MKNIYLVNLFLLLITLVSWNNSNLKEDEKVLKIIYNEQLTNSPIYDNLRYLTKEIGSRINSSHGQEASINYTQNLMNKYEFDTVYLQPVKVPNWIRGENDQVKIVQSDTLENIELKTLTLGNSPPTAKEGLQGEVIEINSLEELKQIDSNLVKDKIVFLNQPLDNSIVDTFVAYYKISDIRNNGPQEASKKGAIGVIVRSLSIGKDDIPHTGYAEFLDKDIKSIPSVAISTNDAELLSKMLIEELDTTVFMKLDCQIKENTMSYNVIGEIKGTEHPEEVIIVGGHLDSWDVGEGAHDAGALCLQAIEVLRTFKTLGIKPKRTLRAVLWVDEENSWAGNAAYTEQSKLKKENIIAAFESDRGAYTPIGFIINTDNKYAFNRVMEWKPLFEPYQVTQFVKGKAEADIEPLQENNKNMLLLGLHTDSQKYFTLHHSENDVFEAVDKRELELGAAAMTSLVYLIDSYGLN